MRLDPVLGTVSWTPAQDQAGVHEVEIYVVDSKGAEGAQHFEIRVSDPQAQQADAQGGETPPAAPNRNY